jgi:pimeloyl-ACP methyl ester carboxylesterase
MLAAKEKRVAGLVLMAGMGTTGRELILEQQQSLLNAAKIGEPGRAERVELQKKILEAAVEQEGWEALPAEARRAVDTPWYRSLLLFDPDQTMKAVKQPVLILQGGRDTQVPPHHADKLAAAARARKNPPAVEVKILPELNHLFVPAKTGAIAEYATTEARAISAEVPQIIAAWLATVAR